METRDSEPCQAQPPEPEQNLFENWRLFGLGWALGAPPLPPIQRAGCDHKGRQRLKYANRDSGLGARVMLRQNTAAPGPYWAAITKGSNMRTTTLGWDPGILRRGRQFGRSPDGRVGYAK